MPHEVRNGVYAILLESKENQEFNLFHISVLIDFSLFILAKNKEVAMRQKAENRIKPNQTSEFLDEYPSVGFHLDRLQNRQSVHYWKTLPRR